LRQGWVRLTLGFREHAVKKCWRRFQLRFTPDPRSWVAPGYRWSRAGKAHVDERPIPA
jgi:hypothetical protein